RRGARARSQTLNEQRRALLLPQEVKELGAEEALVFYEGLRPIRCRKVRYFADWRLRWRIRTPPAVPLPQAPGAAKVTERTRQAPLPASNPDAPRPTTPRAQESKMQHA